MEPDQPHRQRLDDALVTRGLAPSRSRARDAISRGTVFIDGKKADKPARKVGHNHALTMNDPAAHYVSRAALKLEAGLAASGIEPAGAIALDIGASTGGFTQVLLAGGVKRVYAIDVGHGQIHPEIARDQRVTVLERLNARDLSVDHLRGDTPNLLVCDVSFISLTLALPPALNLSAPASNGVFLVKPQFEVGPAQLGKNAIVAPSKGAQCAEDMFAWLDAQSGWRAGGLCPSPISGGDGNQEFLLWGHKAP